MAGMGFEDLEVWKRARMLSAEGFERNSQRECITFLSYATGSCGELRTRIFIGMDDDYISQDTGGRWIKEATAISNMLGGLMKTKRGFIGK
jgi:four helix bundle protein